MARTDEQVLLEAVDSMEEMDLLELLEQMAEPELPVSYNL